MKNFGFCVHVIWHRLLRHFWVRWNSAIFGRRHSDTGVSFVIHGQFPLGIGETSRSRRAVRVNCIWHRGTFLPILALSRKISSRTPPHSYIPLLFGIIAIPSISINGAVQGKRTSWISKHHEFKVQEKNTPIYLFWQDVQNCYLQNIKSDIAL